MTQRTHANITDDIEYVLEDTGNAIFSTANHISPGILAGLREISRYIPFRRDVWLTARDKSREIYCGDIVDILAGRPGYACYPIYLRDTDGDYVDDWRLDAYKRNIDYNFGIVRMGIDNAPVVSTSDDLTGTVTFTEDSTAVTGSGTSFTTELRDGYYVKAGSNWYRVATVTDDTNIVLGKAIASGDDGADTSCSFWRSDVILNCGLLHYLTTQSDLAGALVGAHSKGAWSLSVDALGTGQMDKNTLLTIAGVDGVYRVREDATITTNAATVKIEPFLKGVVPDNAVVTFLPSSLNPELERILVEIVAANLTINWVGDARTSIDTATTHMDAGDDLLNTVPTGGLDTVTNYLNYATGRRGIASSFISLSRWGWSKYNKAISDLKAMAEHKTYRTYSRAAPYSRGSIEAT